MTKKSWTSVKDIVVAWWRVPDRARQGERFGLGVALATAVFSAIALYRGHEARMEVLALTSATLLALALTVPSALYPAAWGLEALFKGSMRLLLYIMLVLIFYIMFAPAGIMLRILGRDPLDRQVMPEAESYWIARQPKDPKRVERQF